jgi:hypothetical protein
MFKRPLLQLSDALAADTPFRPDRQQARTAGAGCQELRGIHRASPLAQPLAVQTAKDHPEVLFRLFRRMAALLLHVS